jgi:hypothetical protein
VSDNILIEKKGVTLSKVDDDGNIVDGLTEEELSEKQKIAVKKLIKVL